MNKKEESKLIIKGNKIAEAIQLGALKKKLANKKAESKEETAPEMHKRSAHKAATKEEERPEGAVPAPRRARSRSVFDSPPPPSKEEEESQQPISPPEQEEVEQVVVPVNEPAFTIEKPPEIIEVEQLGPTGKHIKDLLPPPAEKEIEKNKEKEAVKKKGKPKPEERKVKENTLEENAGPSKKGKTVKESEYRDLKPARKLQPARHFDSRDLEGEQRWRKKRTSKKTVHEEASVLRPTNLSVRLPISIKNLAVAMKLKSSQLISKLFMQGLVVTINDLLADETTIQLLGQEFGCDITIDTSEEEKIRITDKSIREEIQAAPAEMLTLRPPVVTFMGHVDHGKTSLIDFIRKSNRAAGEAGAITQHIGAFRCHTNIGDITVLDTPGHEAFSAMRGRGADVTDIVILVVAGDEGIRAQTEEAIQHAQAAGVAIIVAINKCDKPNFDADTVYRQLADRNLLPEIWGGQTIAIPCSATSGKGIPELLEMIALQSEVLELRANLHARSRGTVLESEMHKGLGLTATVLVQNGTLKMGDALVFGPHWGRVKTMRDEYGSVLKEAPPSTPVEITGLSGLPSAGDEFVVVENDREARKIAEARQQDTKQTNFLQSRPLSLEKLLQQATKEEQKKVLNIVLRADVHGSLEALRTALQKIHSDKVSLEVIFAGVGEISESDVQLAAASSAVILGFHTQVESHAEQLVKEYNLKICLHEVIYHAIDEIKEFMTGLLDKIVQENDTGKVLVKTTFKASQLGIIAGCMVTEGVVHRNDRIRQVRDGKVIWKGTISSLKRVKEDVKEVLKGFECGVLLTNNNDVQAGDVLEAYGITYLTQEL